MTQAEVKAGLDRIAQRAARGELVGARRDLEGLAAPRVGLAGLHLECAEAAMELGLLKLAERELQLELRDLRAAPDEARGLAAVELLAEVQDGLGDDDKAHGYRVLAARARGKAPPRAPASDPLGGARAPGEATPLHEDPPRPGGAGSGAARTAADDAPRRASAPEVGEPLVIAPRTAPAAPPSIAAEGLPPATPGDLTRFLHLYGGREDMHARQWLAASGRGGYSPVKQPLTTALLRSHLAGEQTLGVYQTRVDGTVVFFALDLDVIKPALERARRDREEARDLRRAIADAGLRMVRGGRRFGLELVLEDSGYKGRHAWGFLAEPLPAGLVRNLVKALSRAVGPSDERLAVECFPKQARLSEGRIGNLIKLPLGVHLKTGRRAHILGPDGAPARDPWGLLRAAKRHTRAEVLDALARLRDSAALKGEPEDDEDDARAPAPLPAEAVFTEADFEVEPTVRAVLSGCAVLRLLVERGLERRRLLHEEQVVLRHTLGHLPMGTRAVNYVFSRCPEIGGDMVLKSVLQGNPMSCPKIRKRVPEVTSQVPCHCVFRVRPSHYPTPVLHVDEARARGELVVREVSLAAPAREDSGGRGAEASAAPGVGREGAVVAPGSAVIEELARRYWHLRERVQRLSKELEAAEAALIRALERLPGERHEEPEGVLSLERSGGAGERPRVVWRRSEAGGS